MRSPKTVMSSRRPGVEFCILHSALVPGHRRDRSPGFRRPISVTRSVSQDRRHPSAGRECTPGDLGSCPPRRDNMDTQLLVICGLTFVIHVIVTLAYAVRIADVRTRRIAVSFSLFGIIALVSRTVNSFQGKRVELDIAHHTERGLLGDFRLFLLTATVASAVGAFLSPTSSVTSVALSITSKQIARSLACCSISSAAGASATFGLVLGSRPGTTSPDWQLAQAFPAKS